MSATTRVNVAVLRAMNKWAGYKDDIREFLKGVLIEPAAGGGAFYVASNGHKMAVWLDQECKIAKPLIISSESIARLPKEKFAEIKRERFHFESGVIVPLVAIKGEYADWRALVPSKEEQKDVRRREVYDLKLLAGVVEMLRAANAPSTAVTVMPCKDYLFLLAKKANFMGIIMAYRDEVSELPPFSLARGKA